MGRRCALCNCGDWSLHGQRELQRFEPVPDWPERLVGHEPPDGPGQPPPGPSQDPPEPELAGDSLAQIGFSEGVTPAQLFEPTGECGHSMEVPILPPGCPQAVPDAPFPTGHCWVHHWCAAWAAGAGLEVAGVARAVFSGISQVSTPRGDQEGWQGLSLAALQQR